MPLPNPRLRVLSLGAFYFLLIVGSGGYLAGVNLLAHRPVRASLTILTALLVFALLVRTLMARWRGIRHQEEPPYAELPHDETVWGVGGPAMRVPGQTGIIKRPEWTEPPGA